MEENVMQAVLGGRVVVVCVGGGGYEWPDNNASRVIRFICE